MPQFKGHMNKEEFTEKRGVDRYQKDLGVLERWGEAVASEEKAKLYITTHIALKSLGFDEKIRNRMRYYTIPFP